MAIVCRHLTVAAVWAVLQVMTPAPSVEAQDTLHIDQVIQDVVRHNDRAAAMRHMEEAAASRVGPAGAWDDPMLMLGVANLPTSFDFSEDMMTMKMVGLRQPGLSLCRTEGVAIRSRTCVRARCDWCGFDPGIG
jgi:hypothetical protein